MSKTVGVWIDHRRAVLVTVDGGSTTVYRVESAAGSRVHSSGGWRAGGTSVAQCITNEQTADERRKHQLHTFYQKIIKAVGPWGDLFIFGPGEAKYELAREIDKIKGPHIDISAIEACDKLTEPRIIAKVRSVSTKKPVGPLRGCEF